MSIVVVATTFPKPEFHEQVKESIRQAIARVHAEDADCELYALHEADDHLVMIEKWSDRAALDEHLRSEAFRWLKDELAGRTRRAVDLVYLDPIAAGTPSQGTL